jgi:hypothetical protein
LQQAGNLNALLAFQLAHIILGHRLDTKFAFNDTLIFPTMNPLLAEIAINPAMSGKSNSRQSDGSIYGCN